MSLEILVVNLKQLKWNTKAITAMGALSGIWIGTLLIGIFPDLTKGSFMFWGLLITFLILLSLWALLLKKIKAVTTSWNDATGRFISEDLEQSEQSELNQIKSGQIERLKRTAKCRHSHIKKTINELHALVSQHLTSVTTETNDAALSLINQLQMIHSDMTNLLQSVSENQEASKKISDGSISTLENNTQTTEQLESYIERRIGEIEQDHQIVSELQQQASMMTEMTKMIETVAKQTTILATNAKIEATRAGAHGQAFGVIADEVTNLSAQIGNASKQIIESIDHMAKSIDQKFSEKLDQSNQKKETNLLTNLKNQLHSMGESYSKLEAFNHETLLNINRSSENTKLKVNDSLVAIQFQDMTQQQIEIVLKSFQIFEQYLSDKTCFEQGDRTGSDVKDFDLEQIRKLYVMKKQRDIHDSVQQSSPLEPTSSNNSSSDDIILF